MARRIKIALNYNYNENWIGGTYYIENLVHSLNQLPIDDKPWLLIITNEDIYLKLIEKINYPFINRHLFYDDRSLQLRVLNKFWRKIFKSNYFEKCIKVNALFPFSDKVNFIESKKNIYWIPDFQEHYFQNYFSSDELIQRKEWQHSIIESKHDLVLSSQSALANFEEIYPNATKKPFILPFAVTLPNIEHLDIEKIKKKLSLRQEYYICPNQFWIHKDHLTLIRAISILKEQNINIIVYLTGKTEDYRFPRYYESLQEEIQRLALQDNIISLGFIDREIQLTIIKNSKAVIQPSLFEGWSTVIEDAKSLNKFIIASDIEVHKEQLKNRNAVFFENGNPKSLAEKIKIDLYRAEDIYIYSDYKYDIRLFGENFLALTKL